MRAYGKGFTLIELLVAISLIAILAAIAVPSFQGFIANQRVKTAAVDLLAAMNFARGEAVKRNESVTIAATDGDWGAGWEVTSDSNVLKEMGSRSGIAVTATASSISYRPSGRAGASVSFALCDTASAGATQRIISVDMSGRASIKRAGVCP